MEKSETDFEFALRRKTLDKTFEFVEFALHRKTLDKTETDFALLHKYLVDFEPQPHSPKVVQIRYEEGCKTLFHSLQKELDEATAQVVQCFNNIQWENIAHTGGHCAARAEYDADGHLHIVFRVGNIKVPHFLLEKTVSIVFAKRGWNVKSLVPSKLHEQVIVSIVSEQRW
jgi:hypothetical protein